MVLAAIAAAAPAAAEMYKWVDEAGITHYSDRKPDDPKSAGQLKPVTGRVSVYSPDQPLLQAVEAARQKRAQQEFRIEPDRAAQRYVAPTTAQLPVEPCDEVDCAALYYPYAPVAYIPGRRRPPHHLRNGLSPGAIGGPVNRPGTIPANTGGAGNMIASGSGSMPHRQPSGFRPPFDTPFSRR
jgi:hypothetical protein